MSEPSPIRRIPLPLPPELWPKWAKALALLARAEDVGVGDTVFRVIGAANSAAFKAWYLAAFGQSCGCAERQAEWNAKYAYAAQTDCQSQ